MAELLPPPTIKDVVEAAVLAMSNLIIYACVPDSNLDALTDEQRKYIVEADWMLNSVHDAVTGYWDD